MQGVPFTAANEIDKLVFNITNTMVTSSRLSVQEKFLDHKVVRVFLFLQDPTLLIIVANLEECVPADQDREEIDHT